MTVLFLSDSMNFPITRMRRLRKSPQIREIFKENKLNKEDLIYPIFIKEGLENGKKEEIATMPDEFRYSIDDAVEYGKNLEKKGLKSIIIFGIPLDEKKDKTGSSAYDENGIVQRAIMKFKSQTNLVVITDVCLCQYTSHGHCGIVKNENDEENQEILNDETLNYLSKIAISHAKSGADIVAPSDMMDGRIIAIRNCLDKNGFENTLIMSYSAKYASSFYTPFREAACSSPGYGDRKSYQMNPSNISEAIRESKLDVYEGADVLMVKPALAYLDVIKSLKDEFELPLAAYNVSGEYSMIKAGIAAGYLTEESIFESLISIKRAGADLILTHFAPFVLDHLD